MADQGRPDGTQLGKLRIPVRAIASKEARDLVETVGRIWTISEEVIDSAKLAVSELVTNVVCHSGGPEGDTLMVAINRSGEMLMVEVHDNSPIVPVLRCADQFDTSGRGMLLIACYTDDHGCDITPHGKAMWFAIKSDWPPDIAA
ncbi:ATP-binding protein [Actinocorallia longicatena]